VEAGTRAREGLSTVTRGTLILLLGTLGYVAENFFARVLLVRALPKAEWTSFSLGLVAAGLLAAFGSLGIGAALARMLPYASQPSERRQMIRTAFRIVVPACVVVAVTFLVLGSVLGHGPTTGLAQTLQFLAIASAFSILSGLIASVFQGFSDVRANAYFVQLINPALFLFFLGSAFLLGGHELPYLAALLSYAGAAGATLAALVVYARIRLPSTLPPGPADPGFSRRLLLFAVPLFVVALFAYLTQNADTLLLGIFDRDDVGQYTASLSLARLLQIGIASLGYIVLPVTTRFVRDHDPAAARLVYLTATKWTVVTSLPFFLVFFFQPLGSLGFVYSNAYALDALSLQIIVLGSFLSTLVGPSNQAQVAYGQTTALLANTAAAATADIVLAVLLEPTYGITGAAIAWAVANALLPILSATELALSEGVHPFHRHYLVPLVATVIPIGALLLLVPFHPPLLLLPFVGLAIAGAYVVAVWATRSIDAGDRMLLEVVEGWIGFRLPLVHALGRRVPRVAGGGGPPERRQ